MMTVSRSAAVILCAAALGAAIPAADEDGHGGIVYGDKHAFMVQAPSGWVLDNSSGVGQGLHAVFYPVGSTWADSEVVMYVNTVARQDDQTLSDFIAWEQAEFRKHSPDLAIATLDPVVTEHGTRAELRQLTGDQHGNHEAIAYIGEDATFVMIVLSAKSGPLFEEALPAFRGLVKSYTFITSSVIIDRATPSN